MSSVIEKSLKREDQQQLANMLKISILNIKKHYESFELSEDIEGRDSVYELRIRNNSEQILFLWANIEGSIFAQCRLSENKLHHLKEHDDIGYSLTAEDTYLLHLTNIENKENFLMEVYKFVACVLGPEPEISEI